MSIVDLLFMTNQQLINRIISQNHHFSLGNNFHLEFINGDVDEIVACRGYVNFHVISGINYLHLCYIENNPEYENGSFIHRRINLDEISNLTLIKLNQFI